MLEQAALSEELDVRRSWLRFSPQIQYTTIDDTIKLKAVRVVVGFSCYVQMSALVCQPHEYVAPSSLR